MPSIEGVTLAKINGIFDVEVTNASWDVDGNMSQTKTAGGPRNAAGIPAMSGSFDEVVPLDGSQIDLRSLSSFSVQVYDQPTQKILLMSAQRCDWDKAGTSSAVEGASTRRKWSWKAEAFTKF